MGRVFYTETPCNALQGLTAETHLFRTSYFPVMRHYGEATTCVLSQVPKIQKECFGMNLL